MPAYSKLRKLTCLMLIVGNFHVLLHYYKRLCRQIYITYSYSICFCFFFFDFWSHCLCTSLLVYVCMMYCYNFYVFLSSLSVNMLLLAIIVINNIYHRPINKKTIKLEWREKKLQNCWTNYTLTFIECIH